MAQTLSYTEKGNETKSASVVHTGENPSSDSQKDAMEDIIDDIIES